MAGKQIKIYGAGIYNSPVVNVGVTQSQPRVLMRYEIGLFLKDGGVACLNGHEYEIRENCLMVRKPGDVIYWNNLDFLCRYAHFSVSDPAVLPLLDALPSFTQLSDGGEAEAHLVRLSQLLSIKNSFVQMAITGRFLEFLWHLYTVCGESNPMSADDPCRAAIQMIQRNYHQSLSVEQLAKACNLSPSYFHKLFLQSTGTTPNRYLMLTRLNAAQAMLRRGNQSAEQIAELCGFSSQSYLCDCMKKHTGMSPRQYQRMRIEEYDEI